ncbi:Protein of unknown function [Gryllus bimaculatus]|nr:Protein of unknown function [Gryllus bimaculatus]
MWKAVSGERDLDGEPGEHSTLALQLRSATFYYMYAWPLAEQADNTAGPCGLRIERPYRCATAARQEKSLRLQRCL